MHITLEGDYAVRILVALASAPAARVVRTEDLTHATGVPRAYLRKIVQVLGRAHLLESRQGQGGGVWLDRDPRTITLRQMIEAVEGPIHLNRCLARPGLCPRDSFCPVHPVWRRIQGVLLRELDAVTARDLADERLPARRSGAVAALHPAARPAAARGPERARVRAAPVAARRARRRREEKA